MLSIAHERCPCAQRQRALGSRPRRHLLCHARAQVPSTRRLADWAGGATLEQLEQSAPFVHAPVGDFFLDEPPLERLPIPVCGTIGVEWPRRPSADLLDALFLCQQQCGSRQITATRALVPENHVAVAADSDVDTFRSLASTWMVVRTAGRVRAAAVRWWAARSLYGLDFG
jgi:hypothetical protein